MRLRRHSAASSSASDARMQPVRERSSANSVPRWSSDSGASSGSSICSTSSTVCARHTATSSVSGPNGGEGRRGTHQPVAMGLLLHASHLVLDVPPQAIRDLRAGPSSHAFALFLLNPHESGPNLLSLRRTRPKSTERHRVYRSCIRDMVRFSQALPAVWHQFSRFPFHAIKTRLFLHFLSPLSAPGAEALNGPLLARAGRESCVQDDERDRMPAVAARDGRQHAERRRERRHGPPREPAPLRAPVPHPAVQLELVWTALAALCLFLRKEGGSSSEMTAVIAEQASRMSGAERRSCVVEALRERSASPPLLHALEQESVATSALFAALCLLLVLGRVCAATEARLLVRAPCRPCEPASADRAPPRGSGTLCAPSWWRLRARARTHAAALPHLRRGKTWTRWPRAGGRCAPTRSCGR